MPPNKSINYTPAAPASLLYASLRFSCRLLRRYVAVKFITPKLLRTPSFEVLIQYLEKNVTSFIKPLYGMSFALVLYGLLSPMLTDQLLDKILVFPGFVLAIIASNVARLVKNSDDEERKRALEIISLGLSVIAVLFVLWLLGDEMFDPFTSWF